MNSITQELKYKQSIVKYALRNGVTVALEKNQNIHIQVQMPIQSRK